MEEKIEKIIKVFWESTWCRALLVFFICLGIYFIRKDMFVSNSTIIIINIGIMGLLLVTLYQSIKNRKVYLTRIFFMIAIDFIVNQLYDTKKFYDLFHVNLKEAGIVVALVIVGGILISTSIKEIHKLLIYIQNGIKKCIESEKQEEKKLQGKKINFRRSIAKNIWGENLENVLEKENASAKDKVNSKEEETEKGEQIDKLNVRAFYIILSTIGSVKYFVSKVIKGSFLARIKI